MYPQNLGRAGQGCRRAHLPSPQRHRPPLPFPHPCRARSLTRDLGRAGAGLSRGRLVAFRCRGCHRASVNCSLMERTGSGNQLY